jgi:hypothetical protein
VQAITYFARALGAARSNNPEAAKADIVKLTELRTRHLRLPDLNAATADDCPTPIAAP